MKRLDPIENGSKFEPRRVSKLFLCRSFSRFCTNMIRSRRTGCTAPGRSRFAAHRQPLPTPAPATKNPASLSFVFECFPLCFCPELVLAKRSILYMNGSKRGVFLPRLEEQQDMLEDDKANHTTYQKTRLLLSFPYVCPEPVLAK